MMNLSVIKSNFWDQIRANHNHNCPVLKLEGRSRWHLMPYPTKPDTTKLIPRTIFNFNSHIYEDDEKPAGLREHKSGKSRLGCGSIKAGWCIYLLRWSGGVHAKYFYIIEILWYLPRFDNWDFRINESMTVTYNLYISM